MSEWSEGTLKCGGNYDQMSRERGSETFVRIITIQVFPEKSSVSSVRETSEPARRMTEKTDGERTEAARREAAPGPPPRSYSEFMRNLAAKYNTETTE